VEKHVKGLLEELVPGGVLSLQYADDTLLFSSCDLTKIRNLKVVLMFFERVSGMRINFNKSDFIPINLSSEQCHEIAHILNCPIGHFPFRYLGVPIHFDRLKREDLQTVIDTLIRVAGWRGRLLAYSSRLVLIKTCLASIPIYLLSFIKFPKWAIKLIESQMAHSLWNNTSECHRHHLASWQHVTMKKEFGGLGVPSLRELNVCLLGSWIKRYSVDDGKIKKLIVDAKYNTCNPNIFTCREAGSSKFWRGVIWVADVAKMGYRWRLGKGNKIRF
jgi:hypothetical protein